MISILLVGAIVLGVSYGKASRLSVEEKAIVEALAERDTPALIKSLVARMSDDLEKDIDKFPDLIREMEDYTRQCTDSASVALLHSLTAEMYSRYYQNNRWQISQRTSLQDYIPDDIREWSGNLFTAKVKEELAASLRPAEVLQQTPTREFADLFKKGKDSESLRPTLFDFLAYRAIELQPDAAWFEALLAFHRADGNRSALLMAELDYLDFLRNQSAVPLSEVVYSARLDSMATAYAGDPLAVEIAKRQYQLKEQEQYRQPSEALRDSVRGELFRMAKSMLHEYQSSPQSAFFENQLAYLEQPSLSMYHNRNVYPGKTLRLQLQYQNVPEVTVRIYENPAPPEAALRTDQQRKKGREVKTLTYRLRLPNTYTRLDTTVEIPMSQPGLYLCEITDAAKRIDEIAPFSVSRLATSTRRLANGETEVLVADYWSGKPVSGASVAGYNMSMQWIPEGLDTVKSDANGLACFPSKYRKSIETVRAFLPGDTGSLIANAPGYRPKQEKEERESVSFFTDRSLYRPGQHVSFKGIVYVRDVEKPHVVPEREMTVRLVDAQGQDVAKQTFRSNEFGSFSGEFTLPKVTLNGSFRLITDGGQVSFRVEEYKRPSFSLEMQRIGDEVFFNEELVLKGLARTYSGVNLQDGKLTWTITRMPSWTNDTWRGLGYNFDNEQVAEGTAAIGSDGTFSIPFIPQADSLLVNNAYFTAFNYRLNVLLTDSRGETQECDYDFTVGNRGLLLSLNVHPQMEKNAASATLRIFTRNQVELKRDATFSLRKLDKDDKPLAVVDSGVWAAKDTLRGSVFSSLESGKYRLTCYAKDAKGQKCSNWQNIIIYGKDDKRPPVETHTWVVYDDIEFRPGESSEFIFGTSDSMAYVLYELIDVSGKRRDLQRFTLSNENRKFSVPFREEYGLGANIQLSFVKEGVLYQEVVPMYRRQPNRSLTFHTETFRDKLVPGQEEHWKFRLTDADSLPVRAEVLASMYDFSLDQLYPNRWVFNPSVRISTSSYFFRDGECFSYNSRYGNASITMKTIPEYAFDRLYEGWYQMLSSGLVIRGYATSNRVFATGSVQMKAAAAAPDVFATVEDMAAISEATVQTIVAEEEVEAVENTQPVIRENLAETAFFYPVLVTNDDGTFSFDFTMPESNTTWKLQLLAVTDSLKHGYLTRNIITSKPLMVQPNWPRFLREGDEVTIAAQVINQSGSLAEGRARLELFNPENNQPIICLTKSQKPFALESDSIATLSWSFQVPAVKDGVMACRIVADSPTASDGEQLLLPVIPDKIVVTESRPFFLSDEKEQQVDLPETGKGTTLRAVLEISANPIWYAVQALPTLSSSSDGDALSWFAVYYSNVLADYLVGAHPRLKPVIQKWMAEGGDEAGLLSNLEKNEDLKAVVLAETPWVLDAANETEQMHRLGLLFQANRAAEMRRTALSHLAEQQMSSGAWAWFRGMWESRSITLQILKGMAQLTELGAIQYNEEEKTMQMSALRYLDKSIQKDYDQLRKNASALSDYIPSSDQIEYLYVRSHYRDIPEAEAREAVRYFTSRAAASWKQLPLYDRAAIALVLWRNGQKDKAAEIARWFAKTASEDDEMGVYWKNNRRQLASAPSPVETHCLAVAMMRTVLPGQLSEDGMKQWLLCQKRTQMWESNPASMNAIHALLLGGTDWLSEDNRCVVAWGSEEYTTDEGTTAVGYRRIVQEPGVTTSIPSTVSIRKEGTSPAWGAVYTQRLVPLREMSKTDGNLDVEKKFFVETNNGEEVQLRELKPGEPLRVGDRVVVRLTLRTDREMTFVALKDLRAGCFEPAEQLSGAASMEGIRYYRNPKDLSENFYFDRLPVGTYVLEYKAFVSRAGEYAGGIATLQCLYAPEFTTRTEGQVLRVE